jgi:hypothetical protein
MVFDALKNIIRTILEFIIIKIIYPISCAVIFVFNLVVSKISKIYNNTILNITNTLNKKIQSVIILFNSRKFILKKYFYTINHKKLGLYYFYFSLWTGCSGALLATMIRLEMAYPGSPFFKGDSLKYLQVMTAHALIMIFFVVVPIFFGGFANFLLPYHIGSKDVAFPRLNSIGF